MQNYEFTYDGFGNMLTAKAGSVPLATYTYAANNGPLTSLEYGNDDTISYTYDNLGRVKTSATSGGKNVSYAYNGEGQLYKTTVGDWGREYVYDTLGRPVSAAQFKQETVNGEQKWVEKQRLHNKYNDENQLIQQTRLLPEKTITTTFGYDSNGRLTTYNSGAGYNSTLTYDALSRLSTVTDRTNKRTYSYADGADAGTTTQVSQVTYTGTSAGTGFEALTYSYTYDSRGNILTITDPISGNRSHNCESVILRMIATISTYRVWNYFQTLFSLFDRFRLTSHLLYAMISVSI